MQEGRKDTVGFIGLGMMGRALAEGILAQGFQLTLGNRTAGKTAAQRRYDGDLQATLDVWNDAPRDTIAGLDESGMESATLQPFKALLDRAAAAGYGDQDIAAVFETLVGEGKQSA